jgi:hypothetical protein
MTEMIRQSRLRAIADHSGVHRTDLDQLRAGSVVVGARCECCCGAPS